MQSKYIFLLSIQPSFASLYMLPSHRRFFQLLRNYRPYSTESNQQKHKQQPQYRGFIRNLIENIKYGFKEDKEIQASLKGLEGEMEKIKSSKVLNTMKQQLHDTKNTIGQSFQSSFELVGETAKKVRIISSKKFEELRKSKGVEQTLVFGTKVKFSSERVTKKISEQAKLIRETPQYKSLSKGVNTAKQDLLDDIIEESDPYKPQEKLRKRTDPNINSSTSTMNISTDTQTTAIIVSGRGSVFKEKIMSFIANNWVTNRWIKYKIAYDESDNLVVRSVRTLTEKVGDTLKSSESQDGIQQALTAIKAVDFSFTVASFLNQCKRDIIPNVLEAFLSGKFEILSTWCNEPTYNLLKSFYDKAYIDTQQVTILNVYTIDLFAGLLINENPVLFIHFDAQILNRKQEGDKIKDYLENVTYRWGIERDINNYDSNSSYKIVEFIIDKTAPLLI